MDVNLCYGRSQARRRSSGEISMSVNRKEREMTRTKLHTLAELGQSVWLDYIQRSLITSGGLQTYINKGLRGITSNPSLFEKAIAETSEYDDQIQKLALEGKSPQ